MFYTGKIFSFFSLSREFLLQASSLWQSQDVVQNKGRISTSFFATQCCATTYWVLVQKAEPNSSEELHHNSLCGNKHEMLQGRFQLGIRKNFHHGSDQTLE